MAATETAFGLRPFEPYDHEADAEELEAERREREDSGRSAIVQFFRCPYCDGHGAKVDRTSGKPTAVLCDHCDGEGRLGATEDDLDAAGQIGSDNPFCPHDWSYTGTQYGGDDERWHGEGRCYCRLCGADGDA